MAELIESAWTSSGQRYRRFRDAWSECGCSEISESIQIGGAHVTVCIDHSHRADWISVYHDDGDGRQKCYPCIMDIHNVKAVTIV